jgi:DNA polymerase III epsilon subunit-like protein
MSYNQRVARVLLMTTENKKRNEILEIGSVGIKRDTDRDIKKRHSYIFPSGRSVPENHV